MADFKKLSSVETINEVTDNVSLLIENNGNINKVSKDVLIKPLDWETLENKPFYDATTFKPLVTNYLVDFSTSKNQSGVADFNYDSGIDLSQEYEWPSTGAPVRIVLNNEIYDCKIIYTTHMGDQYMGTSEIVHNGHRFVIYLDGPYIGNLDNIEDIYTLSIYKPQFNIKTLEEKFIPEYDLVFEQLNGHLDMISIDNFAHIPSEKIEKFLQKIINREPVKAIYRDRRVHDGWFHCGDYPLAIDAYGSDIDNLSVNCHTFIAFDVEGWVGNILEFVYDSSRGSFDVGCSPMAV